MIKQHKFIIYSDGGSRGNPGPAAYGFVIYDQDNQKIYGEGKSLGEQTNNFAEYSGVKAALEWIKDNAETPVEIDFYLDSQLAREQLSGNWKIKNEAIRNFYYTIKKLEDALGSVSYTHVLREKNKEADRLVNLALDGEI